MTAKDLRRRLERLTPAAAGPFCECGNPDIIRLSWGEETPDPGPCDRCGLPRREIHLTWGECGDDNGPAKETT